MERREVGAIKAMVFDLDGTLTPSKQAMQAGVAREFARLTRALPTGVISGGSLQQFSRQLLTPFQAQAFLPENLHLMPTCGTRYYRFENGGWQAKYVLDMDPDLAGKAKKVIEEVGRSLDEIESYMEHIYSK